MPVVSSADRPAVGSGRRHESHPSKETRAAKGDRSMSNQVWILVAVVVIIAIIFAYQRSRQSQVRQTRDLRMGAQEESRAQTPGDEISQREERRLTGMSAEDRDWEQSSLQRNRDIQDERTRQVQGSDDQP